MECYREKGNERNKEEIGKEMKGKVTEREGMKEIKRKKAEQ